METPSVKHDALENLDRHIAFSEERGTIEIRDRRLFRRGHELFCHRLVEAAARSPGIRSASVSLGSVTCRFEFDAGWRKSDCMARRFVEILNVAIPELARNEGPVEGESDWATITAFPAGEKVSCWEAVHETPERLRLHNEILRLDSIIARQVAKALRGVPGIVSCRVVSFGRDLRISYDPAQRAALAVLDTAESCLQQIRRANTRHGNRDNSRKPLTQLTGTKRTI